jgi:hypothetical protein
MSLLNYRLSTIAAGQKNANVGSVQDIDTLTETFPRELKQLRKEFNPEHAKEALAKNPNLETSFRKVGLPLKSKKGKEHADADEELPRYEEQAPVRKSSLQELEEGLAKMAVKNATK